MSEKEKNIEKYPIHNPDDESQGMELINKEEKKKGPGTRPGEFKYVSFEDWLKVANTFSGKHEFKFDDDGKQVEESLTPQGSYFGGPISGLAKKSSYKQPGQGKTTIGGEGSMKAAGSINPLEALDIQAIKEQLDPGKLAKLERIAEIIDMDVDEIIKGAISGSTKKGMTVNEMLDLLIDMYL